jgi:anti-sigma regulatory factor (Ser/Thr protein kinase)
VHDMVTLLPPRPSSACVAREVVAWQLREWHFESLCEDAAVIVTELISNAVRHAGTELELRLVHLPHGLRLEVSDGSQAPPMRRPAGSTDEGGRGLQLVDALSTRYGVEADGSGKRVWVEMLVPA